MSRYFEGCTCHIMPPCPFCISLSEKEADVMWNGGREALEEYRRKQVSGEPSVEEAEEGSCGEVG